MAVRWFNENGSDGNEEREIERKIRQDLRDSLFTAGDPASDNGWVAKAAGVPARILLAEDDAEMRGLLTLALSQDGHRVTECANGIQLLDQLSGLLTHRRLAPYDLIISDIRMPGLTALEILRGLQGNTGLPPTILITAFGDDATHAEAKRSGAVVTLDKPFEMDDLLVLVRRILRDAPEH